MTNPLRDLPLYFKVFQVYLGRRIYLVFLLTMFAALSEGFGILMILPLLEKLDGSVKNQVLVNDEMSLSQASNVNNYIYEVLTYLGISDSITAILIAITIAYLLKGILTFGALSYGAFLNGQLLRELKKKLFSNYSEMEYSYYSNKDTGYFTNIINEQTTRSLQSFKSFTNLAGFVINTIVYLGLAFAIAWRFGLMALIAGIIILIIFRRLNIYVRQLSRMTASENGRLSKLLIQILQAFKYLAATNQINSMKKIVINSIEKLTDYQIKTDIAKAFTISSREPITVVLIMVVLIVQLVIFKQRLEPILVSILLFYRGLNSILAIQGSWQTMLETIGSMELVDKEFKSLSLNHEKESNYEIGVIKNEIEFKRVCFRFDEHLEDVIKKVSLKIPVKTTVAFVGKSGSGKTTLVDILTLMHKTREGHVYIDGINVNEVSLPSWRKQIGYVSQETAIFNDTIANNICLWSGDFVKDEMLKQKICDAAYKANLSTLIESLPNGYETLVGDRGVKLSGGQRQRLFIARELFREPSLLILDEATSSLDSESEKYIQQSIDELKGQTTVVIIAHRLSTIRNVDRIFVLDEGRLIEQGTYQELKNQKNSHFARYIEMQEL